MWIDDRLNGIGCVRWVNDRGGTEASATTPAKHGPKDWRAAFHIVDWTGNDLEMWPTAPGMLFNLAFMATAQWDCFHGSKRDELFIGDYASGVLQAGSIDEIRDVIEEYELNWKRHRAGQRDY